MWIRILNHNPCPKTSWFLLFHHHQSHFKHSSPERLGSTSLPPKAVSPYPLHVIHKGLQPDEDQCPFSLRQQTQELNISQKKVHYFVKSDISRQDKTDWRRGSRTFLVNRERMVKRCILDWMLGTNVAHICICLWCSWEIEKKHNRNLYFYELVMKVVDR